MIRLRRGGLALDLVPQVGGGVARLALDGVDVLRPAPAGPGGDVLALASFPLAPFANRIAHGRFAFGGRQVRLSPNMGDHPHPLHGQAWRAAWSLDAADEDRAVLSFVHPGGEWPWAYRLRQTIALSDHGARFSLSLTNLADGPAPAGLGFHPYFPGRARARLTARFEGVWGIGEGCLPTACLPGPHLADWRHGADLAQAELIDHCHVGWDGAALIELIDRGLAVRLSASPELAWLHVFSPPSETFFCVEPVSHRPDALNAQNPAAQGIRTLAPGAEMTASMTLEVSRR